MTRRIEGLDPHPSPARIRELFRQKTGRDVEDAFIAQLTHGTPLPSGRPPVGLLNAPNRLATPVLHGVTHTVGDALTAKRLGDSLELTLCFAPRTKKNSTTLGVRQSPQYRKFRDDIKAVIAAVHAKLGLPLPPRPQTYNLCAVYYVDRYGKTADLFGLHDGLADALQNAGVIENDWQFRTADGSRIVVDDPEPRMEITITRIES